VMFRDQDARFLEGVGIIIQGMSASSSSPTTQV